MSVLWFTHNPHFGYTIHAVTIGLLVFFFLLDLNVVVVGYVRNKKELSDFIGQEDNRSTDTNQNVLQIYYCPLRPENPVAFAKLRQGTDSTALG